MTDSPERQSAENGPPAGDDEGRNDHGQFAEGNPGGPGRPKGQPNKVNAVLKDEIMAAYALRGGVEWLRGLKDRDFVRLLAKVMPKEIVAEATENRWPLTIVLERVDREEIERGRAEQARIAAAARGLPMIEAKAMPTDGTDNGTDASCQGPGAPVQSG